MLHCLRKFAPFQRLNWAALNTVARHTRLLCLPADRCVLRPGRRLSGAYYLHKGRLKVRQGAPGQLTNSFSIAAGSRTARHAIYPGSVSIVALSPVQLLHVDTAPIAFLLDESDGQMLGMDETPKGWEARFLSGTTLQRLDPVRWQQVLVSMERICMEAGERVIVQGQPGEHFFVLRSGHAVVHRATRTLCYLNPGDFFGEDALISGQPRNASVTLLEDGELMRMEKQAFIRLLLQGVVRFVSGRAEGMIINVGKHDMDGALWVPLPQLRERLLGLSVQKRCFVVGGALPERVLGAFLLAQHGVDVSVVNA